MGQNNQVPIEERWETDEDDFPNMFHRPKPKAETESKEEKGKNPKTGAEEIEK